MFRILKVRYIQVLSEIREMGPINVSLVSTVFLVIYFTLLERIDVKQNGIYLFSLSLMAITTLHIQRADLLFIKKQVRTPLWNIYAENFILLQLVGIPLLIFEHWYLYAVLVAAPVGIGLIPIKRFQNTVFPHLSKFLPIQDFEWLAGIRSNYRQFIILILIAIVLCWLNYAPILAFLVLTSYILMFYIQCESRQMLTANYRSPKQLLLLKIKNTIRLLWMIEVPILIINSIVNPDLWWLNFGFLIFQITLILYAITMKYANYAPCISLTSNIIFLNIALMGCLVPIILPIMLFMIFRNFNRSLDQLSNYFYD